MPKISFYSVVTAIFTVVIVGSLLLVAIIIPEGVYNEPTDSSVSSDVDFYCTTKSQGSDLISNEKTDMTLLTADANRKAETEETDIKPQTVEKTEETDIKSQTVEKTKETDIKPQTVEKTEETDIKPQTVEKTEETHSKPQTVVITEEQEIACVHASTTVRTVSEETCTQTGEKQVVCERCNAVIETQTVSAAGHSWSAWTETKKATTVSEGERQRTCSVCKTKQVQITEKVPKIEGNTVEIPSAGIYCSVFITEAICKEDVDIHDVVYMDLTQWFFKDKPCWVDEAWYALLCGHDYKTFGDLPLTRTGTDITMVINGKTERFTVVISEKAVNCTVNGYNNMRGVKTGALLYEPRETETIRLYTCYKEERWLVVAEKVK